MKDFNPDWLFPCTCGDRTAFGVVHMKDEPCYRPDRKHYHLARVKFNNGYGALLCNECSTIIAEGWEHEDRAHLCEECKETKYEDN